MGSQKDLTARIHSGLKSTLGNSPAMSKMATNFLSHSNTTTTSRRRVALLDLNNSTHNEFWQILHNTPERFKVISSKESHQNSGYLCRLVFDEIGEHLAIAKSLEDLLEEYVHGI